MTTHPTATTRTTGEARIEADPTVPVIRITRDFRATPAQLLRAHTDPELYARWVGPDSVGHTNRLLGRPHGRQLAVRQHAGRRRVRVPRLLPRDPRGPDRPDLHLGGRPGRRLAGDAALRGPRRRLGPAAQPVARRQLRGARRVAPQRH